MVIGSRSVLFSRPRTQSSLYRSCVLRGPENWEIMANSEQLREIPLTELSLSPSLYSKRRRNQDNWKKTIAKKARNSGKAYVSAVTNRPVSARAIGAECSCQDKCFEKLGNENISAIFDDFYASGCWDTQTAYIQKQTVVKAVKRHRTNDISKQRSNSKENYVKPKDKSCPVKVCKKAFASIHGISVSRIDRAQKNKTSSDIPIKDRRGLYGSHNAVSIEKKNLVIKHITSFKFMRSHYSRRASPKAKYFDCEIQSEQKLHELYVEWLQENFVGDASTPVTLNYYLQLKKAHYPYLRIYKPRQDTCETCDRYKVLPENEKVGEKKAMVEAHQDLADEGYKLPMKLIDPEKGIGESKINVNKILALSLSLSLSRSLALSLSLSLSLSL